MERQIIRDKIQWHNWCIYRRKHDPNFEANCPKWFPVLVVWVEIERKCMPHVEWGAWPQETIRAIHTGMNL